MTARAAPATARAKASDLRLRASTFRAARKPPRAAPIDFEGVFSCFPRYQGKVELEVFLCARSGPEPPALSLRFPRPAWWWPGTIAGACMNVPAVAGGFNVEVLQTPLSDPGKTQFRLEDRNDEYAIIDRAVQPYPAIFGACRIGPGGQLDQSNLQTFTGFATFVEFQQQMTAGTARLVRTVFFPMFRGEL